jgi:2,3-bisphosphoglycerate-independent phosphoglycerate mutase
MDPVEPGLGCGSDTAHMSIFGYPPRTYAHIDRSLPLCLTGVSYYRGRGAFESMGAGLDMQPGDIAFKVDCTL